jgi:hypothetical protein
MEEFLYDCLSKSCELEDGSASGCALEYTEQGCDCSLGVDECSLAGGYCSQDCGYCNDFVKKDDD